MPVRETVRTLRLYFIVSGTLGLLSNLRVIAPGLHSPIVLVRGIINLSFAIVFLYLGFALRRLLVEAPGRIRSVIMAAMGWAVLSFLLHLTSGFAVLGVVVLAVVLLFCWYLLDNVQRLAIEAKDSAGPEGTGSPKTG